MSIGDDYQKAKGHSVLNPERHRRQRTWDQAPLIDAKVHPVRPLVVVLDQDMTNTDAPPLRYLRKLLSATDMTAWQYADGGPPEPARTLADPHTGIRYAPGWIEVRDARPGYDALLSTAEGVRLTSAWPGFQDIGVAVSSLGGTGTHEEKLQDVLAAGAASAAHADAFVTDRTRLLTTSSTFASHANPYDVFDALTLVGLHQRSQDLFMIATEGDDMLSVGRVNRGLFYWGAARALTPSGWGWLGACVDTGDDSLIHLAQSALARVDRTLRLRDDVFRWLMLPQNNDTADETLAALDALMLTLHGAFDAAARVAHRAMSLPGKDSIVGWHRAQWIDAVRRAGHPQLAQAVQGATEGEALLQIIRSLRNTVHGRALSSVAVSGSLSAGVDTQLALPAEDVDRVLAAIDTLGSREDWGISDFAPTRLLIRPAPFIEQIMSPAYRLLDTLMGLTPVHLLLNGRPPLQTYPPEGEPVFDPLVSQRILWQLGLAR